MAKAVKKQALGRGLSALLKDRKTILNRRLTKMLTNY